jgi:tRNA-modifying protein YgfZ
MTAVFLSERQFLLVSGADAESFLQNLITTDLAALEPDQARPGALLTPQGKIMFDFMISREGSGFVVETDAGQRDNLLKRLTMYRLRAAVELSAGDVDGVTVAWGDGVSGGKEDSRFVKAGIRLLRRAGRHGGDAEALYAALRIEAGVAISGSDFALSDAFPHDVLMDFNGGLSFRKGCYVGQEVVSRMQHRGTARRRVVIVKADSALPPSGAELSAGGKPVGTLGSVIGNEALAIVRIDRAGEAMAKDVPILAGGVEAKLTLPAWSGLTFPTAADEATA